MCDTSRKNFYYSHIEKINFGKKIFFNNLMKIGGREFCLWPPPLPALISDLNNFLWTRISSDRMPLTSSRLTQRLYLLKQFLLLLAYVMRSFFFKLSNAPGTKILFPDIGINWFWFVDLNDWAEHWKLRWRSLKATFYRFAGILICFLSKVLRYLKIPKMILTLRSK